MRRYPEDRLFEEVAFVAYHFNWSREEVLNMAHWERQRWCEEISAINERLDADAQAPGGPPGGPPGAAVADPGRETVESGPHPSGSIDHPEAGGDRRQLAPDDVLEEFHSEAESDDDSRRGQPDP